MTDDQKRDMTAALRIYAATLTRMAEAHALAAEAVEAGDNRRAADLLVNYSDPVTTGHQDRIVRWLKQLRA